MSGLLSPDAALREFSDLGLVLPGAKLHTYVSGTTSTPLATYSDGDLAVPNTNPIIASAGGLFGAIYLTLGVAYKYVLKDASDVTIWTRDPVMVPAAAAALPLNSIGVNNFRLTLESGVPVSVTDQTAKTTLYLAPYNGNRIDLYDAAGVPTTYSSAQFSIAVPATTSTLYDVFVYNNAGVPTLELLAWTSSGYGTSARATAIVLTTTGTYTKSGDLTRRYVGTFATGTVSGQTNDSAGFRQVSNYYNRDRRELRRGETAASWPYTTATLRQANANTANQVEIVVGVQEALLDLWLHAHAANSAGGLQVTVGIGEDSTSTTSASAGGFGYTNLVTAAAITALQPIHLAKKPAVGRHFYSWNEYSGVGGVTTWYGGDPTAVSSSKSGLTGWIEG